MFRNAFASSLVCVLGACSGFGSEPTSDDRAEIQSEAIVCDPNRPNETVERLLRSPVIPPQLFGGVALTGGTWTGISIDDLERAYCRGVPLYESVETQTVMWRGKKRGRVAVEYAKDTRLVKTFTLEDGYEGKLEFASRPTAIADRSKPNPFGKHRYSIAVGRPILRDGQPWTLNWTKDCKTPEDVDCWERQATEMFDALVYTFAPELQSTQESCIRTEQCLAKNYPSGEGAFGVRLLGIYFNVKDTRAAASSTPAYFYGFPVKLAPFSAAEAFLKLDAEGPTAIARGLGERRTDCMIERGVTFASFLERCVHVAADANANALTKTRLLGGASRDVRPNQDGSLLGTWRLEVTGLRPSFSSARFDEREPSAGARVTEVVVDNFERQKFGNDFSEDGQTLNYGASSVVYAEYVRLVQAFLHAKLGASHARFSLGAPECLLPSLARPAAWRPAQGCTGMEQFVLPGHPSAVVDAGQQRMSLGGDKTAMLRLGLASLFQGRLAARFCADAGTFNQCGDAEPSGLFSDTRAQVLATLGESTQLPAEVRDRKTYVRLWANAFVKYLTVAKDRPRDLSAVASPDREVTIEPLREDLLLVRYGDRFECRLHYLTGQIDRLVFR